MEMKWTGAGSGRQRRRRDRREGERDAEVGRRRRGSISGGVQRRGARGTVVGGRDRGSIALSQNLNLCSSARIISGQCGDVGRLRMRQGARCLRPPVKIQIESQGEMYIDKRSYHMLQDQIYSRRLLLRVEFESGEDES